MNVRHPRCDFGEVKTISITELSREFLGRSISRACNIATCSNV